MYSILYIKQGIIVFTNFILLQILCTDASVSTYTNLSFLIRFSTLLQYNRVLNLLRNLTDWSIVSIQCSNW